MHASTSVHTQDVSARDCQNNGQSHDQERISRILQISNRPVCSRWLPKPLGQTTPSIGLHQNTLYHSLGEGGCMTHRHQPYGYCNRRRKSGEISMIILRHTYYISKIIMSGTIRRQYLTSGIAKTDYRWRKRSKPRYMPHSCSALRKSEYLTTNEPTPPSSSARILRRRSVSSFNRNHARIPCQRIGHLPVHSIRLVIDFPKTDQLGLGRLLTHCRQDETDVNCIVSIMKN